MNTPGKYDDSFSAGKVVFPQDDIRSLSEIPVQSTAPPKLDIQLDVHGKHYVDYVTKYCMGKQICEGFDYTLEKGIDNALANLTFHEPYVDPYTGMRYIASYRVTQKDILPPSITPQEAIDKKKTYAVTVMARFSYFTPTGNPPIPGRRIKIFDVPIPIGSKYCHTSKLSPQQKIDLGIHRKLVQGVFIIKGVFKTGISHDLQVVNRPLVYHSKTSNDKPLVVCNMTCVTKSGTVIVQLDYTPPPVLAPGAKYVVKKIPPRVVTIHLPSFEKNEDGEPRSISVYSLYAFVTDGLNPPMPSFDERIIRYVMPAERQKVMDELKHSYLLHLMEMGTFFSELRARGGEDLAAKQSVVINQLFPHINDQLDIYGPGREWDVINDKLETLAMMTALLIRTVVNVRQYDQRDFLKNKRIQTIGKLTEQLIGSALRKARDDTIGDKANPKNGQMQVLTADHYFTTLDTHLAKLNTNTIEKSFGSKWGDGLRIAAGNKSNIETPNTTIYLALLYYVMRIVKRVSDKDSSREIRQGQPGNTGFIGFFQTPERAKAGIVLALAMGCRISNGSDFYQVYQTILHSGVMSTTYTTEKVPLILSGRFIGYCHPQTAMTTLLRMKRYGHLPRDTGIVASFDEMNPGIHTSNDRCIYVCIDAGRPYRPLLTVDSQRRELIIDVLDRGETPSDTPAEYVEPIKRQVEILKQHNKTTSLWNVPIDELLAVGAVEYIDAFEQSERCIISPSYDTFGFMKETVDRFATDLSMFKSLRPEDIQENEFDVKDWTENIEVLAPLNENFALVRDYLQGDLTRKEEAERIMDAVNNAVKSMEDYRSAVDTTFQRLKIAEKGFLYNYCEVDPTSAFTDMENAIGYIDSMMGPRVTYGLKMQEADLKIDHDAIYRQFYSGTQYTFYVNRPLVQTQMFPAFGMDGMNANGYNVTAALMTFKGLNQEDALIVNRNSVEMNNLFSVKRIFTFEVVEGTTNGITVNIDWFLPPDKEGGAPADLTRYHAIVQGGERNIDGTPIPRRDHSVGLPRIGSRVDIGDCVIRAYRTNSKGERTNASVYIGNGESGIVSAIQIDGEKERRRVTVSVIQIRKLQPGDKINSPQGQKTTVSRIMEPWELPVDEFGRIPDIIANPLQQPGRMTPGMMFEMMAGKLATRTGNIMNATAFRTFSYEKLKGAMSSFTGKKEIMSRFYSPDGEEIKGQIFTGVLRIMASRHRTADKHQARGFGTRRPDKNQPGGGRAVGGGLRYGEGESFATLSHGASGVLYERLVQSSDGQEAYICIYCREQAIIKTREKVHTGLQCLTKNCPNKGRSNEFVRIVIPGVYKYLKVNQAITGSDLKIAEYAISNN